MLKVVPKEGFKNSVFYIEFEKKLEDKIYILDPDGIKVEINTKIDSNFLYFKGQKSGNYFILAKDEVVINNFIVNDYYLLGSSVFKRCFLFEGVNYFITIMKDRTTFYHLENEAFFDLYRYSPDNILLTPKGNLIFETKINDEIQNLGLFDLNKLSFSWSLEGLSIKDIDLVNLLFLVKKDQNYFVYSFQDDDLLKLFQFSGDLLEYSLKDSFFLVYDGIEKQIKYYVFNGKDLKVLYAHNCTILFRHWMSNYCLILKRLNEGNYVFFNWKKGEIIKEFSSESKLLFHSSAAHIVEINDDVFRVYHLDGKSVFEFELPKFYYFGRSYSYTVNCDQHSRELFDNSDLKKFFLDNYFEEFKEKFYDKVYGTFYPEVGNYRGALINEEFKIMVYGNSRETTVSYYRDYQILNRVYFKKGKLSKGWGENKVYEVVYEGPFFESVLMKEEKTVTKVNSNIPTVIRFNSAGFLKFSYEGCKYFILEEEFKFFVFKEIEDDYQILTLGSIDGKLNSRYIEAFGLILVEIEINFVNVFKFYSITNLFEFEYFKVIDYTKEVDFSFKNKYYIDSSSSLNKDYILTSQNVLVSLSPFEIKGSIVGEIIYYSPDINNVVTLYNSQYHLYKYSLERNQYLQKKIYKEKEIKFDSESSVLLPNEKALVKFVNSDEIKVYDFSTNEYNSFFSGRFLGYTNEGNLILETHLNKSRRVFDPFSLEDITPAQYHYYRFLSPDGKLYSQLNVVKGYFNFLTNSFLDNSSIELKKLLNEFVIHDNEDSEQFELRYEKSISEINRKYGTNYKNHKEFLCVHTCIEIGIVGTDVICYLPVKDMRYYNYISFSYDNKYVCYVGKPNENGLFEIYEIGFNEEKNSLKCLRFFSVKANYATWVCSFNYFSNILATYDSSPDTYFIFLNKFLFDYLYVLEKENDNSKGRNLTCPTRDEFIEKKMLKLKGKSFQSFSHNGKMVLVTEHGYDPISLGGKGHLASSDLFLYRVNLVDSNIEVVFEKLFNEHGSNIRYAGFSHDDSKVISIDSDGVIIVRNIHFSLK